jgi:hypothetical protein
MNSDADDALAPEGRAEHPTDADRSGGIGKYLLETEVVLQALDKSLRFTIDTIIEHGNRDSTADRLVTTRQCIGERLSKRLGYHLPGYRPGRSRQPEVRRYDTRFGTMSYHELTGGAGATYLRPSRPV